MSDRLNTVKALIEPADVIADVGCDHALIAEYCVKCGVARHVIASDISEKCLQKARKRLSGADNVTFRCCDGIAFDCDEAVIAGMGGLLITEILLSASSKPQTLVLCPHRDDHTVRKTLVDLGYVIDKDIYVIDNGKFYSVMRAKYFGSAQRQKLSELQLLFGVNVAERNAVLAARLNRLYGTYMRAPEHNKQKLQNVISAMALQGITPSGNQFK